MKKTIKEGQVVTEGQTQQDIDATTKDIVEKYSELFEGIGQAKVEPVQILVEEGHTLVQQKWLPIALYFEEKFKDTLRS